MLGDDLARKALTRLVGERVVLQNDGRHNTPAACLTERRRDCFDDRREGDLRRLRRCHIHHAAGEHRVGFVGGRIIEQRIIVEPARAAGDGRVRLIGCDPGAGGQSE